MPVNQTHSEREGVCKYQAITLLYFASAKRKFISKLSFRSNIRMQSTVQSSCNLIAALARSIYTNFSLALNANLPQCSTNSNIYCVQSTLHINTAAGQWISQSNAIFFLLGDKQSGTQSIFFSSWRKFKVGKMWLHSQMNSWIEILVLKPASKQSWTKLHTTFNFCCCCWSWKVLSTYLACANRTDVIACNQLYNYHFEL